jgi:hypothetical protein
METAKGQKLPVRAIGGFIGSMPKTNWVPSGVTIAKGGRVKTNRDFETELPGVYAVGDMREGAIGRVTVAAGEGQFALRQANVYLGSLRKQTADGAAAKPKAASTFDGLITRLVDLDKDNPWFGQTAEDVPPLKKKSGHEPPRDQELDYWQRYFAYHHPVQKFDESEPRDDHGRWTDGGGSSDDGDSGDHPGEGYSKNAYVDAKGVIHTNSVRDAAKALGEDRKVELKQPKQVSTLIKELGKQAQEMQKQGKNAPNYNLCNVSVAGTNLFCVQSKGIPRVEMPQMDDDQTKAFVEHLKDQGQKVKKGTEYAANLRATQSEINGVKVAGVMDHLQDTDQHQSSD